jgi:sulfate adenylyltransferase subunit 1
MELLRFFTAGNVDDGKSTLIGRLLYDSKSISTDIIETLTRQSKTTGTDTDIDLALLTDGLRAEREQGITIDVAYKYFSTEKRKFIIADTPGHAQYTRNMFTGASNADLAIVLIDARNGITDQTKRHSIISGILGIPHILICVNKMDLVDYKQEVFEQIKSDYLAFSAQLGLKKISFIPVSALAGDNVVNSSEHLSWYKEGSLFEFLENVEIEHEEEAQEARFQVQYVIRPQTDELHDYRGYAGSILSGSLKKGDQVQILPLDVITTIEKIEKNQVETIEAQAGEPVVIHLKEDFDVSRGSTIVKTSDLPQTENTIEATICWMDDRKELKVGNKYTLQHGTTRVRCSVKGIEYRIDVNNYEQLEDIKSLKLNDIAKISLRTAKPLAYDAYQKNRANGAAILIDETSNVTVGACMVEG